ncbi:MAG: GAF domain-containing protein [Anaerolineae bacterium]
MSNREKDYYHALYDIAHTINSSLDLPEVLQRVTKITAEHMHAKACSIRLLSRDRKRLIFGAAHGLSEQYLRKGDVEVDKSGVDRQVLRGNTIIIPDATEDERFQYPEWARVEGIRSVLVVPLATRGQIIGVMRVYTAEKRDFSDEEIEFLSLIADLSALAIDNARLYQLLKGDYEMLLSYQERLFDD